MNIAVVGTGYVGLVVGTCLAELGNRVWCVDVDANKVARLQGGEIPIYEPGLEPMLARNVRAGNLVFSTMLESVLDDVEVIFMAVGTPSTASGGVDMSAVHAVAHTIGCHLNHYVLVVNKSTVPVGTADRVRAIIQEELDARGVQTDFDIASNPEFLKEGNAVEDFMKPARVVVGVDSDRARDLMAAIYKPMQLLNYRVYFMDVRSAEMTKYAANAMLATRISFMNDIANLCERVGADVDQVRIGMGSDPRIGLKFLYPGCGYGGSCFPKDVRALIRTAIESDYRLRILEAVEEVNEAQKEVLFRKFYNYYKGDVADRRVAVWGLAFKPQTDDMREAPSLVLIEELLRAHCEVRVYDPVAMDEARRRLGDSVVYASNIMETVEGADAIFHVTEWKEYRMPDWTAIRKAMREPLLIDGRNVFDANTLDGFTYIKIG